MSMRFGRALAIYGMGVDCHAGMPPSQPPVPPAPVNPVPVPSNVVASMYAMYPSQWLMGKFSKPTVHTEGDGGLLAGHDWGVGQPHLFTGPVMIVTPSAIFTALGASHKYWIPCSAVQEPVEGGLVNGATGGSGAIAPVGACCLMSTQNCMDVSGAGFNAPTGIGISTPTTRQVGVTCGDIVAGIVSLLTDCLASFASSKLGGAVAGQLGAAAGGIGEAAIGTAVSVYVNAMGTAAGNSMSNSSGGGLAVAVGQATTIPIVGPAALVAGGLAFGSGALAGALQEGIDGPRDENGFIRTSSAP